MQPRVMAPRNSVASEVPRKGRKNKDHSFAGPHTHEGFQHIPKPLRSRLKSLGVQTPNRFQRQVLPAITEGRDVLGSSPGGAGKTTTLVAGMLERAWREGWSFQDPCVLLAPTRLHAEQAYVIANQLRRPSVTVLLLCGEVAPQSFDPQRAMLQRGAHVIVGTPNRVQQMVELGLIRLEAVRLLALDEAEHFCTSPTPTLIWKGAHSRQTVVFSGSPLPRSHQQTLDILDDPLTIDFEGTDFALPQIRHCTFMLHSGATKRSRAVAWLLERFLIESVETNAPRQQAESRAIIFANTKEEVAMISTHVMLKHRVVALHAGMPEQDRISALEIFRASESHVLLTTDSSVRGVELPRVLLVIHLAPPRDVEVYAHRVSWVSQEDAANATSVVMHNAGSAPMLAQIERGLRCEFEKLVPPSDDEMRIAAVEHITRELRVASSQYDMEQFLEDAAGGVDTHGPRLLAAALVLLERRNRAEEWVSPLSGRPRYTPLLLFDPFLERLKSRQAAVKAVSGAMRQSAEAPGTERVGAPIGRIELTAKGYVVDVPHAAVARVLRDEGLRKRGISVMPVAHLPALVPAGQGPEENSAGRRPRRQRERFQQRAPQQRGERRLEFLFPAGRRSPLGKWRPAGQQDAGGSVGPGGT